MTTTPDVKCRHCGKTMKAEWQSPITASRPGFFYLTCWDESCKLYGQTFTDKTYAEQDLTAYYRKQLSVK